MGIATLLFLFLFLAKQPEFSICMPPKEDIIAVVDVAARGADIENCRSLLSKLLDRWSISPSTSRVSLFLLAKDARLLFGFKSFCNRECIAKVIEHIRPSDEVEIKRNMSAVAMQVKKYAAGNRRTDAAAIVLLLGLAISDAKHEDFGTDFVYAIEDVTSSLDGVLRKLPWQNDYVSCVGSGLIRDECERICECRNGRLVNCYRLRRELSRLSANERQRFFQAFYRLGTDPVFKATHKEFLKIHATFMCVTIHNEDYFNPWHRWYLVLLENSLQEIDCRITIPYWDWSYWKERGELWSYQIWNEKKDDLGGNGAFERACCVPTGMYRENQWQVPEHENLTRVVERCEGTSATGRKRKPLVSKDLKRKRCLRRWFADEDVKSASHIDRLLGVPLDQFRDAMLFIRFDVHNHVHLAVGGTMASPYSADTPEFWLHHAMLDKIWYLWQERGEDFKYAYYKGMNRTMFLWPYSQEQMIDSENLPKCIRIRYDAFPEHEIVPFSLPKFPGKSYLEKSVCDKNKDILDYNKLVSKILDQAVTRNRDTSGRKMALYRGKHVGLSKNYKDLLMAWLRDNMPFLYRAARFKELTFSAWERLWKERESGELWPLVRTYGLV